MALAIEYYTESIRLIRRSNTKKSMFYLGAALHLIQDVTIPQHVNIRLLEDHRQFENFVKRTYQNVDAFQAYQGAYVLHTIESYMRFNARTALKIYRQYRMITDDEKRYYLITKCTLPLAQRTTAGAMVLFHRSFISAAYR